MKKIVIDKYNARSFFTDILFFVIGSIMYSAGILYFAAPNNIAPGGASGIGTIANYLWGFPIGLTVLAINIPLIIIGWLKLGGTFIFKTATATIILSVALDLMALFMPEYTGDRLLASIFGGIISGAGLALFFVRGATSGGTDIIVHLLQKKMPHFSTGRFVLLVDLAVVAFSVLAYKNIESALYAVIYISISSKVIDEVLFGQINGKVITVITKKEKEIAQMITKDFSRGVTVLPAKGGYTGSDKAMLYCAVRKSQVSSMLKAIRETDSEAFTVISKADEISGEFER